MVVKSLRGVFFESLYRLLCLHLLYPQPAVVSTYPVNPADPLLLFTGRTGIVSRQREITQDSKKSSDRVAVIFFEGRVAP